MNRIEIYNKTTNILLDAYNSRELESGDCKKCAVGNIFGRSNIWITQIGFNSNGSRLGTSKACSSMHVPLNPEIKKSADELREKTGYTWDELMQIEDAFEGGCAQYIDENEPEDISEAQEQLAGLTAVLDRLQMIHDTEPNLHTTTVKKFTEVYDKLLV